MAEPKKPVVEVADILKGLTLAKIDDEAGKLLYPIVFDLLAPRYKDGACTRQAGKLTLKVEVGTWQVQIECPSEKVQTRLYVRSLDNFLQDVENLLASGKMQWGPTWDRAKKDKPALESPIQ